MQSNSAVTYSSSKPFFVKEHCVTTQRTAVEQTNTDQEPITGSEQLPYLAYVTAFLRTSLFLETF